MNKRGGEKLLAIWWFFVLIVIGVGIVAGVLIFYNANVDARTLEAQVLSERIFSCIVKDNFFDKEVMNNFDAIYKKCGLNDKLFTGDGVFYFKISLYDGDNLFYEKSSDLKSFETDCAIASEMKKADYFPRCVKSSENVLFYDNNELKSLRLEVLAGSNQFGRRVSLAENDKN
ncbi:hypothetical protein J4217_02735 [Candidatus Pacearchaeota archaeon]|nr:hypothetical protein [Candidatus Pacearchaeota archaeon]